MPLSAQATGWWILFCRSRDGQALLRHAANPSDSKRENQLAYETEQLRLGLRGAEAIYELFRHEYDLDFSMYKEATVLRRIGRRLAISECPTIDAYAERLKVDKAELTRFIRICSLV